MSKALVIAVNNLLIHTDPLEHWNTEDLTPEEVMRTMGLIPMFVGMAFADHTERTAEAAVEMYSQTSGGGWSVDPVGSFTPEGVKTYPGDPDQYPLLSIMPLEPAEAMASDVDVVYIYEHEWVAFKFKDGTYKHLRMD